MHLSNKYNQKQGIQNQISKVKQQLDKLSTIITKQKQQHQKTLQALMQCHVSSESQQSLDSRKQNTKGDLEKHFYPVKLFNKIQFQDNNSFQQLIFEDGQHLIFMRDNASQQSQYSTEMQTKQQQSDLKAVDITIKKGKPLKNIKKKEQPQVSCNKGTLTKLKNVKSQKKFAKKKPSEPQSQKITKKYASPACRVPLKQKLKYKTDSHLLSSIKNKTQNNIKQEPLTSVSQSRGLSSKYHLNLKQQVNIKINDLKLKKLLCQKQSEYLSAALKITKEEIQKYLNSTTKFNQEGFIKLYTIKIIVKFFSQFMEDLQFADEFQHNLNNTIENPNQIIKLIMKLPDILRKKNTLCEDRCKALFEQYQILNNKLKKNSSKIYQDNNYLFINQLYHYIYFLLDNDMVHQTKRRNIFTTDLQLFSDRSAKEKKTKNTSLIPYKQKRKQYDTERKNQPQPLKRTNTAIKMFSPKVKKLKK